jgi:acyl dehydratase
VLEHRLAVHAELARDGRDAEPLPLQIVDQDNLSQCDHLPAPSIAGLQVARFRRRRFAGGMPPQIGAPALKLGAFQTALLGRLRSALTAGTAPGANEVLGKVVIPRPLLIPADLAGSAIHVDTAPDGDFASAMTRNETAVASITVHDDASATLATSGDAPVTIAAGDVVRFVAPATPDAAIAGISLTIAARRLA